MKKIIMGFLTGILLLFFMSKLISPLKAMQYNSTIFGPFETKSVYRCYKQNYDSINNIYTYSWDLYLFKGEYVADVNLRTDAYVLYDFVEDDILEYSFTMDNPWGNKKADDNCNLIYLINGYHMYCDSIANRCHIVESNQEYAMPMEIQSLEYQHYIISSDLSYFNIGGITTRSHTIDNAFYFQNLATNFGTNVNHSCAYVAMGMLLSYYKEFYDGRLIPSNINTTINNTQVLMNYDDYYNETSTSQYNISTMESPGANDEFHNFLIDYGSYEVMNLQERKYSVAYSCLAPILYGYLEFIYGTSNSFFDIDYRLLSDERFYNIDEYCDLNSFPNTYTYYDSQLSHSNLLNLSGTQEYVFDLLDELDAGYPVLVCLSGYDFLLEIENYDEEMIQVMANCVNAHVAIAYGYEVIDNQVYYRCHLGSKLDGESLCEAYLRAGSILENNVCCFGVSLRPHSNSITPNSGYHSIHDDCDINLPTNVVYNDFNSFARGEFILSSYDSSLEYYSCPQCLELMHAISHIFEYTNTSASEHSKHCNCGYSILENHISEHYTDLYGHVQHCLLCNSYYRSTSEIINIPISEFEHQWSCSLCNSTGISLHDLIFIPLNSSIHIRMCTCCSYSEHIAHGVDESEIQYYPIDSTTHYAMCDRCGFAWIENHNNKCHCL